MNNFGGDWTENKIEILVEYARAYLTIMNSFVTRFNWKLLYFDGFASSGQIIKGNIENQKIIVGAATRILEIEKPRPFDLYFFVDKETENVTMLKQSTESLSTTKKNHIVNTDCNEKIQSMSKFGVHQKVWGKIFLIYLIKKLVASIIHLKRFSKNINLVAPPFLMHPTSTVQGRLLLNILGSLAEFERDTIRERTKAGLSAAKARG